MVSKLNYNKLIIALVVVLVIIVLAGGVFVLSVNNAPAKHVNNTTANNTSSNVNVEKINTEEVIHQSASNTHIIMGEDGYYFVCDDNGNILQNLGPSKKYYPNNPSAVDYPDAEPANRYINKK